MARALRDDIQGLRALAVAVVVTAHAGVAWLPGGYVGVDVFFVISGYLIAGLLYREVSARGTFSLAGFWSRRARRILPAATLVTAATVATSLSWSSLLDTRQVVEDAGWATLFAANVHFAQRDVDYFAQDLGVSPLQHYWSLAVEEQFYVVWPLLLLACLGLARLLGRGQGGNRAVLLPRALVAAVLVGATATSFAWSVHQTGAQPTSAYFSTLTRAWELGLGALVALVPGAALRRLGRRTATLLATVGLAMVGVACARYTEATPFPGSAAALPVVGTALVLVAGGGPVRPLTDRLLALPPVRVVGDWSYSLYLWHWPALVLPQELLGRPLSATEVVVALAVTGVLAGVTYHAVELPFREGGPAVALRVPRALALYPLSVALVAATCGAAWWWTGVRAAEDEDNPAISVAATGTGTGTADDTVALVRASVDAARARQAVPSKLSPDLLELRESIADVGACDYGLGVRRLCPRGDTDAERTVVVIGDSHARAWIPAFDRIAESSGWTAYYLVMSQCTAARVVTAPIDQDRPFTECTDFQDWVGAQVAELRPELVVVTSSPPVNGVYVDGARYEALDRVAPVLADGYDDLFADLRRAAERVVLLRDVPKSSYDPGTCLTSGDPDLGDCSFEPVERSRRLADVAVRTARLAGAEVVDPTPWLCYQDLCPVVIGGTLSYRDTDHLTTEYAASLAGALGRELGMLDRS